MKLMRSSTLILPIMSVLSALTVCSVSAQSEKFNYDTVIATWQPQQLSIASIDEAEKILTSSRYLQAKGDERERIVRFTNIMRQKFDSLNAGQKERLVV